MFEFNTEISETSLHECMEQYGKLYKKSYIIRGVAIAVVLCFLLAVIAPFDIVSLLIAIGLIIFVFWMIKFGFVHVLNMNEELITRSAAESGLQNMTFRGELNDRTITLYKGNETKTILLNDILNILESQHYFMLLIKGKYCMVISKSSIKDGSAEEFKNRVSMYAPNKNRHGYMERNLKYI
ncbi:MAG: YcxB family protein [Eubacteriales bacterium]|nr:YcxB family protein [Eubacteriales bacterium]